MTPPCSQADHERLKRDGQAWPKCPAVGLQPAMDDVPELELRNCGSCGSTLAKEVLR